MNAEKKFRKIQELVYELKVSDVMEKNVITIPPDTRMSQLREILRDQRISGTPVLQDNRLVGMISIEDLINWQAQEGHNDCPVSQKMSSDVKTAYSDEPLVHALSKLEHYGFGRLPIIQRDSGALVGIITKGIIIEGLLRELEVEYHEEEIHRYRASHIFEDIIADQTSLIFQYQAKGKDVARGGEVASGLKKSLRRLELHPDVCRRTAIAAYEAEMNLILYTSGGHIEVVVKPDRIHMDIKDTGPGIPDIKRAMEPGYSTAPDWVRELGFGAGMGLNNIQKCSDEMDIHSQVGEGTKITINIRMDRHDR
jgi:CBS domain-containing protein/anti-sigma regulatory factor (Ser/Thr protein kinase)